MLQLGATRDELSIVGDQIGCPTYAQDIAKAIVSILPQLNSQVQSGVYHYCGDQCCSWYDFAKAIFKAADMLNANGTPTVHSIKTSDYPTLAVRPMYSVLDCTKISYNFNVRPPTSFYQIGSIVKKIPWVKS